MPIIFTAGLILILLLITLWLVWRHLFFRDAFTAPPEPGDVRVQYIQDIPFLIEHGLPYPAGIQGGDRTTLSLDGAWSFHTGGASERSFVQAPSCFNTADSPLRDYLGEVYYEKEIRLPGWTNGVSVRLVFLGSFYRTSVWLDGRKLGAHEGGYLPFTFDLTSLAIPGGVHRLKVQVDNRIDAHSLPQLLFPGHNPGWQPYGGLHRSVYIEICPPQYVFKLQVEADPETGQVHAAILLHRPHAGAGPLQSATLRLLDANGKLLSEVEAPLRWDESGAYGALRHTFSLPSPHLWAPSSPHLYRLEAQTAYERVWTQFGFCRIAAREGKLLLNGEPLILRGVSRHQEDRPRGLAQAPDSIESELRTIQSLHGNFARLAHYPHSAETLALCDQLGLCAWVEIPLYQTGLGIIRYLFDKTEQDTGKTWGAFPKILWDTNGLENHAVLLKARAELLKMIERDRNHPGVLFWGLGNECWTVHPSGAKALGWLRRQAEALDTSRLFAYAAFAMPALSVRYERAFEVSDIIGVNEYFGWYYRTAPEAGAFLQALAEKYPHKPLLVTETGADALRGQHTDEFPPPRGYSEEYQAWLLEEQWRQMRPLPNFAGLSLWVLKDFLCPEYREDNPVPFYNLKGLLDRDGQPKLSLDRMRTLYAEDAYRPPG